VFEPHTERELEQIVDLMLDEVRERLQERGIDLKLTDAARAALVKEGYDPTYGARPLRRVIQRRVENAISKRVLAGDFTEGDTVRVDLGPDGLVFSRAESGTAAASGWGESDNRRGPDYGSPSLYVRIVEEGVEVPDDNANATDRVSPHPLEH
jgi:hypothetical protein